MKSLFTPEITEELGPLVRKTLISAFNVMFNLDPSQSASCEGGENAAVVAAHIELKTDTERAVLNVAVTEDIINNICKMLSADDDIVQTKEMGDAIACEVANIVGHAIRSYFIETSGKDISVGVPRSGLAESAPSDFVALSLRALGKTNDAASIDFVCSQSN